MRPCPPQPRGWVVLQDIARTCGNHFRLPKSCRNPGIAFPNLLIPEFAGSWSTVLQLLANEHLARNCVPGSHCPTGQIDQLWPASCFSYSFALCTWKHAGECLALGHHRPRSRAKMVRILTIQVHPPQPADLLLGCRYRHASRTLHVRHTHHARIGRGSRAQGFAGAPLRPSAIKFSARNLACTASPRNRETSQVEYPVSGKKVRLERSSFFRVVAESVGFLL
jgi:hypothetical protein